MAAKTPLTEKEVEGNAHRHNCEQFIREQLREDIQFVMDNPESRRVLRLIFGPQVSNLFGENCEERTAAVALLNQMLVHDDRVLEKLFASKEIDENGWT